MHRELDHLQARPFADQRAGGDVPLLDRALEVRVVAPGGRPRQIERRAAEAADVAHRRDQSREHLRLRRAHVRVVGEARGDHRRGQFAAPPRHRSV